MERPPRYRPAIQSRNVSRLRPCRIRVGRIVVTTLMAVTWFTFPTTNVNAQTNATHSDGKNPFVDSAWEQFVRPTISSRCLDCHDASSAEGGIDLERFDPFESVTADLETWSRVLKAIESGAMPPADYDPLPQHQKKKISEWILQTISENSADRSKNLNRVRRLTRIEYENTVRDLFRLSRNCFSNPSRIIKTGDYFAPSTQTMPRYVFAVSYAFNSQARFSDIPDVRSLPIDPPIEHGFANDQSALSLSPLQLENYLSIANDLVRSDEFAQISGLWNSLFLPPTRLLDREEKISLAEARLKTFLPRAFRRPISEVDLGRYRRLFASELDRTEDYTDSMQTTVAAILASPSFLFRSDFISLTPPDETLSEPSSDASDTAALLNNFALANRLSYFLWSSMPDEELFQAAREQRLSDPAELRRQVRRMMKDQRIKSLATDFGMQWLKVNKVASVRPDKDLYPQYYFNQDKKPPVAVSMMIEQLLLFESILVEDRSILDFLNADYAYLNRQLMDWYGVKPKDVLNYTPPKNSYEDFFRIQWPEGHRGGVITSGATLISTSTTQRTSPVYRGAWIMDVIFNAPPPPAPNNVPLLDDPEPPIEPTRSSEGQTPPPAPKPITTRQRLEAHRADASCATCHDRIDPLGFALENFDAVGRWRRKDLHGNPVDASTEFLGNQFSGAATLKNMIRREQNTFVRAFVGHTMKYALGRELHYTDEPEVRRIADKVTEQQTRFSSVIEAIVLSDQFSGFPKTRPNPNAVAQASQQATPSSPDAKETNR